MTTGQFIDYTGGSLLDDLAKAHSLHGGCCYDDDRFKDAFLADGIRACIPGRGSRNEPGRYYMRCYRRRSRINITLVRFKD